MLRMYDKDVHLVGRNVSNNVPGQRMMCEVGI